MIQATIRDNIKMPKFNFQKDLMTIAQKIFIPLMVTGIDKNRDIEGKKFPKLEPKTIKRKGSNKPLVDTGDLRSAFQFKKKGKFTVIVDLKDNRALIGKYLQVDGIVSNKGPKHFKFFGVTEGMQLDAMDYMRSRIKKAIKNAK